MPVQDLSKLTGLNALNISFNPMPKFPPVIARLGALMELNLDYTGGP
jgi:Leucine-rich repeat (LRR) protein